ncbi:MAG TPA: HEAT repeat domain-containing protein, partial [Magnetospirillaceae bacterium]|nr:HEAT repeat domain-containing protein [Magnetospirillaceae bacterium]
MEQVAEFLNGIPALTWIAAMVSAVVAASAVLLLMGHARFRRSMQSAALDPASLRGRQLGSWTLLLRQGYILRRARTGFRGHPGAFPRLPETLGYGKRWIDALERGGNRRTLALVLEFLPNKGLFACFRAALRKEDLGRRLLGWAGTEAGAFALRRVALSGPGRDFDGKAARDLLSGLMDEVRALLGDPEWAVRVFAVRILLHDQDERTERALRTSLADPHRLARRLIVEAWVPRDRTDFYGNLYGVLVSDPAFEVRKAARVRIRADYQDLYKPDTLSLEPEQVLHVLELLEPGNAADEAVSFRYLESGTPEEKLAAAECLQSGGALSRMLDTAAIADAGELERRFRLLDSAAELQVTGFLEKIET